ncbi:hypothetical protein FM110_06250 [Brachybacterium nesterenkovii]|uniref:Uncharacterized protein n=1 Tax=Brachybacterium nesterenkovii TaxID=47847 RepID=A0A1X6WYY4_9MICO|nr:hypothetical protein FM110_06250 [Brachybacterium nesterenkovii]
MGLRPRGATRSSPVACGVPSSRGAPRANAEDRAGSGGGLFSAVPRPRVRAARPPSSGADAEPPPAPEGTSGGDDQRRMPSRWISER